MSYRVLIWDNAGRRQPDLECAAMDEALRLAKRQRTMQNRTVKIAHIGNAIKHWTRTTGKTGNHWSARATADERFI